MKAEEILKELVAIDTIADNNNHEIMDRIGGFFLDQGFKIKSIENKDTEKSILIAEYGKNPAIGFLGHTDTVAITEGWETDPFTLTEKEGKLYGLGACDMKGGLAAVMAAISETDLSRLKRGIKVIFTYDEEILFQGIKDVMDNNIELPPHMIVAEPTDNIPMTGSKGLLEYKFTFKGETTHSSLPIDGKSSNKNAVSFLNSMMDLEAELREEPNDFFDVPYTTMNIGIINGGTSINKVPAETTVYLDFRICNSEKEYQKIRKRVDETLEKYDASYEIINDIPSFLNDGALIKDYEDMTRKKGRPFFGITEASFFGGDRVIIGPGPMTAHEKNEHISKDALLKSVEIYKKMIEKLCK